MENDDMKPGPLGVSPHEELSSAVFRGEPGIDIDEFAVQEFEQPETTQSLLKKLHEAKKVIYDMENGIVMLKDYIIANGLKPIWGDTNVAVPLNSGMAKNEILEKNKAITTQRRVLNPDALKQPTHAELEKLYADQIKEQGGGMQVLAKLINNVSVNKD